VRIQGLFEAPRVVSARIAVIDLLKNSIILEPRE
jgi:predicted RNA-binding protein